LRLSVRVRVDEEDPFFFFGGIGQAGELSTISLL
jgi:hypothetical protein